MNPEHTEERNVQHKARHDAAVDALRAAFAAYQEWQEDEGDWDTFVDWVDDEGGPSTCGATHRRLGEFDVDDPPEAPADEPYVMPSWEEATPVDTVLTTSTQTRAELAIGAEITCSDPEVAS